MPSGSVVSPIVACSLLCHKHVKRTITWDDGQMPDASDRQSPVASPVARDGQRRGGFNAAIVGTGEPLGRGWSRLEPVSSAAGARQAPALAIAKLIAFSCARGACRSGVNQGSWVLERRLIEPCQRL